MSKTNRFRLLTSQSFIIGVFFSFVLINSIFIYQAKVANGATQIGVAYLAKCGLASDGRSMPIYDIPQPGWPDQRIVLGNCAGRSISKYPYIQLTANKTVQLTCWDQYLINYQVLATHTGVGTYYDSANSFCNTNNGDLVTNIRLIANPSPTLISLSTTTVTQGGSMVIFNGTSFLGTNNTIQISSNNSTFTNLTTQNSTNGTSIGPVNIVVNTAGNYFLRVNNTNGSTNSIPFKVVTPSTPSASVSVLTTILTPEKFTANPATIFPISFRGSNIPFSGNTVQISKDNVSFSNLAVTGISVTGSGSNEFLDFKAGMTGFGIFYIRISNSKGLSNSLQYKITPYNVPAPATTTIPVVAKLKPTDISAVPRVTSSGSTVIDNISIAWTDPNQPSMARNYLIERSVDSGSYVEIARRATNQALYYDDLTSVSMNTPNIQYRVRILFNDSSYSNYSDVASAHICGVDVGDFQTSKDLKTIYSSLPTNMTGTVPISWPLSALAATFSGQINESIDSYKLPGMSLFNALFIAKGELSNLEPSTQMKGVKWIVESIKNLGKKYKLSPSETDTLFAGLYGGDAPFDVVSFKFVGGSVLLAGAGSKVMYEVVKKVPSSWPKCINLDSYKMRIVFPFMSSPVVNSVNQTSGNEVNVSGSGFSDKGSLIKLIPKQTSSMNVKVPDTANVFDVFNILENLWRSLVPFTNGQVVNNKYYAVDNVTSFDSNTFSFTVPANVPDGVYKVSISNINSLWVDTEYTITVSGHGAGDPSTAIVDDDIIIGASVPGTPTPVVPAGSGVISCEYRNTAEFDRYGRMQTILSVKSGLPSDSKKYLYMMHATTIDPALKLVNLGYHYLNESWNWTIPGAAINLKTLKNVYIDVSLNNNGTLFKRVSCQQK